MLTFLGKIKTSNVLNDDNDYLVNVLLVNDDDNDVQKSSKYNAGIANDVFNDC